MSDQPANIEREFLTDPGLALRMQQIENTVLHQQAVLPGIIRDLETETAQGPARRAALPLRRAAEQLLEAAGELRELRQQLRY